MKKSFLDRLLLITNTEVCFTFSQYRAYEGGDITLSDVYLYNKLDKEIGELDHKTYRLLSTSLASMMFLLNTKVLALANPLGGLDNLGNKMLGMFQSIGYWIAIIMCLKEIIQAMMQGGKNTNEILGIIMKYAVVFASMYLVPLIFDSIRLAF